MKNTKDATVAEYALLICPLKSSHASIHTHKKSGPRSLRCRGPSTPTTPTKRMRSLYVLLLRSRASSREIQRFLVDGLPGQTTKLAIVNLCFSYSPHPKHAVFLFSDEQ